MISYLCQSILFAEAQQPAPTDANPGLRFLGLMAITALLFYFIMLRPQKQKEQELRQKIQNLKENDRVITIGGIYGIVTNVQREAERVTIRVDESTGTKLRVNMSAVARVLTGDDQESETSTKKS